MQALYQRCTARPAMDALWVYIDERRSRQLEQRIIECELPVTHLEAVPAIVEPIFLCNHDETPHSSPPRVPQSLLLHGIDDDIMLRTCQWDAIDRRRGRSSEVILDPLFEDLDV